jgi:hypothetical protein
VSIESSVEKSYRKFESEIIAAISTQVNNFFSLYNWDYGQTLRDVDLIKSLASIKQVDNFEIYFTTDDEDNSGQTVSARYFEIIRPDNINISLIYE